MACQPRWRRWTTRLARAALGVRYPQEMATEPRSVKRSRARMDLWRAGEQALTMRAYNQAAASFERALTLLDPPARPDAERAQLLLLLAGATHRGGDLERATQAARAAATEARRLDSAVLLAQAGFIMGDADLQHLDGERLALLAEARMRLDSSYRAIGACLDAYIARELALNGDCDLADALSRSALLIARGLDDQPTLASVLERRCKTLKKPWHEEERLALSAELLDRALRIGDDQRAMEARFCRVADLLALGDPAFDVEIRAADRIAESTRQPYHRWWCLLWRSMRVSLAGNFSGSKRLAAEAYTVGSHVRPQTARIALTVQTIVRLWQQGEPARLLALVDGFAAEHGATYPQARAARVWALAQGERRGDASRELASPAAADFGGVLTSPSAGVTAALLAETCAMLDEGSHAEALHKQLLPYVGRVIIIGPALDCLGPADRYLGLLAALRQDWPSAEECFGRSLEISRRLAAPPFIARTLLNHVTMLNARARHEDGRRTRPMLDEALTAARYSGLTAVARQIEQLQQQLPSS